MGAMTTERTDHPARLVLVIEIVDTVEGHGFPLGLEK
jgi:hypothetical protein